MGKKLLLCAALALPAFLGSAAYGYSPTLVLGLKGGGIAYQSAEEDVYPLVTSPGSYPLAALSGVLGWRSPTASGGYVGLAASARLEGYLDAPTILTDLESLAFEAGLPTRGGQFELAAGLEASAVGDGEEPAHAEPSWQAGLRLGGEDQGTLAYLGFYHYQPSGDEDRLYEGLRAGVDLERSVRLTFHGSLEGGWEYWPEYFLFDASGTQTGEARQDLVGYAQARLKGLAGFFLEWSLGASAGLRWSSANRYTAAAGLEPNSESYLSAGLDGALDWSPHRQVGLQLSGFLLQEWYLSRAALTAAGADTGELLRVLSLGLTARADWTPNNRLFFVAEGRLGRRFANDPTEERWDASIKAGIEYSF
jgi:hypothetical protein